MQIFTLSPCFHPENIRRTLARNGFSAIVNGQTLKTEATKTILFLIFAKTIIMN